MPLVFTLGAMAEIFRLQGREADARAEQEKAAAFALRQEAQMAD